MIAKWIINTIAILIAVHMVPGIEYQGEWWGIFIVVLIFGLVNTMIRPIVKLFTLPFLILTLGLFTFIINAMMLSLTAWVSGRLDLGFTVKGFSAAFWGSLIISSVSVVLSCLLPDNKKSDEDQ